MTVLKILAFLAVLAALVWSALALNEYSEEKYRYHPFNVGNTFTMVLSIVLFVIAVLVLPEGQTLSAVLSDAVKLNVTEETSNTVVLIVLAALVAVIVYVHTAMKSNILIATYAMIVQFLAALLIFVILVLALMSTGSKHKRRSR